MKPCIQIAGVRNLEEVQLLLREGVDDIGFPLGPGVKVLDVSEESAVQLIKAIPPPHAAVFITYLGKAREIAEYCSRLGVRKVQLHGAIASSEMRELKVLMPGLFIIRSLVVEKENLVALEKEVEVSQGLVDAFLTDTFDPKAGARGATGKTHDWSVSQRLIQLSKKPVILAGGLTPENVAESILATQPAGVDSHTGVERADGAKDPERVKRFVSEARRAFSLIRNRLQEAP